MPDVVTLTGLDFGTTTSSAVVAEARLLRNSVNGRVELTEIQETYRSELVFTPWRGRSIDLDAIDRRLDEWLAHVTPGELFGGGALLTGLTAQSDNAEAIVQLVRRRLGDTLVARADDPGLESWLAFMGSCSALSRSHAETPILNLDIGGGTANLALGVAGEVRRTGCLFVGARHVQVEPGTYRIVQLSSYARTLFTELKLARDVGDTLTASEIDAVMDCYVGLLDAAVRGGAIPQHYVQVPFVLPADVTTPAVTFSGGVGELIYRHLEGQPWPDTTCYGDLGIDLARRLVTHPLWRDDVGRYRLAGGGRATVFGLLRHSTDISGNTMFLPRPDMLPLTDLPILGRIRAATSDADLAHLFERISQAPRGGCLAVTLGETSGEAVRRMGQRIAAGLRQLPESPPLVLIVEENLGKTLGHYATDWGAIPANLIVIDEVSVRDAQYVHLGRLRDQVLPVSFYGLR